ncbi:MAG: ribosome silencing factor [Burkholderiales bacterium PBB1]|nr:MAG: ribosome silencing factor [Burkholderiales bacterium PBB1]
MDIKKLQRAIVDGLEDVKGQNILVFDTEHLSSLFERVIIASGTSNRQTKSLASSVRDAVKQAGFPVPRTEGEDNGEWIIVDCGAAVVHLMQPNIREYYHLEEIWGEKPVKLKLDTAPKRLVKAEEPPAEPKKKAPARKAAAAAPADAPAKKTPARKAPARAAEPEAAAPAAKRRPAAAKTAAPAKRAAAPTKTGVTRTVGVRSAAGTAAKTPARKATAPSARVAKKAPVQVIAVNKPTTKKAANARAAVKAAPAKRPAAKSAAKPAAKAAPKRAPRSA